MLLLLLVAGGVVFGLFLIWSFCRAAGLADRAMEDMP